MNDDAKTIARTLKGQAQHHPMRPFKVVLGQYGLLLSMWPCLKCKGHWIASACWGGKGKPGKGDDRRLRKVLEALGAPEKPYRSPGDNVFAGIGDQERNNALKISGHLPGASHESIQKMMAERAVGDALPSLAWYWRWEETPGCTSDRLTSIAEVEAIKLATGQSDGPIPPKESPN